MLLTVIKKKLRVEVLIYLKIRGIIIFSWVQAEGHLKISMVEDEETGEGIQSQERTSTGMFLRHGQVCI